MITRHSFNALNLREFTVDQSAGSFLMALVRSAREAISDMLTHFRSQTTRLQTVRH